MSQNELNEHTKDNQLADFADQVLEGKMKRSASHADDDLIALEETILRLNSSLPSDSLNDAEVKQMLVRFKARVRREEQAARPSFWKRLFDFQANPQMGLILAVVVVVLLILVIPAFPLGTSTVTGTASSSGGVWTALGLIGVLLFIYWFSRRK